MTSHTLTWLDRLPPVVMRLAWSNAPVECVLPNEWYMNSSRKQVYCSDHQGHAYCEDKLQPPLSEAILKKTHSSEKYTDDVGLSKVCSTIVSCLFSILLMFSSALILATLRGPLDGSFDWTVVSRLWCFCYSCLPCPSQCACSCCLSLSVC